MAKNAKQRIPPSPSYAVEFDREDDGRWIAEIPKLPGVMAYGLTKQEALRRVYAVALRTLADSIEGGALLAPISRFFGHEMARR
jgi:predicted RNase H-like HicB family nuclease